MKRSGSDHRRINGAMSKGPFTEEGKKISSENSYKHGLYCPESILKRTGKPDELSI